MSRLAALAIAVLFAPFAAPFAAPLAAAQTPSTRDELVKHLVRPESTDSALHRFTEPHYVVFERGVAASAPLLVFMPGTGGKPERTSDFADVAARQGYRVIGLEYVDEPAVAQICPRDPDPRCSERVRRKRIYGEDVTRAIDDRPEESIVHRLTALLVTLQRDHPTEGWSEYLDGGAVRWDRIAVSGLSQGAGMAAYIAQQTRVARVILFSSPWDSYGPRRVLAPWVAAGPGATPAERWFAVYHEREPTAALIARAYAALRIPSSQLRVFTMEPSVAGAYHPSVVGNGPTPRRPDGTPAYADDWRFLLGDVHQRAAMLDTTAAWVRVQMAWADERGRTWTNDSLRTVLLDLAGGDQVVRRDLSPARLGDTAFLREMHRVDSANGVRLRGIIARFGWPTRSLVGSRGASAAWLVVQHGDSALRAEGERRMLAAGAGEVSPSELAMLIDRRLTSEGRPQRYGTQLRPIESGTASFFPIDDLPGLERRRAEVGLPPMPEYIRMLQGAYTVKVEAPRS